MKIQNLKKLIKIATKLDQKGLTKEADALDSIINKVSSSKAIMHNYNIMMDRRTNAESASKFYDPRSKTLNIPITHYDEETGDETEEILRLPTKMQVCDLCGGTGKHVDPRIDAGGLTHDDLYEDPDFAESYYSGHYDIDCNQCHGNNVIPVVNEQALSEEQKQKYYAYLEEENDRLEEEAADRRTRFYESGGYGW